MCEINQTALRDYFRISSHTTAMLWDGKKKANRDREDAFMSTLKPVSPCKNTMEVMQLAAIGICQPVIELLPSPHLFKHP